MRDTVAAIFWDKNRSCVSLFLNPFLRHLAYFCTLAPDSEFFFFSFVIPPVFLGSNYVIRKFLPEMWKGRAFKGAGI